MSDASSPVTYTSVYTNSDPWSYYGEESAEAGSPGVIVYGYDGLPMQPIAPPSPECVPRPEHPSSPDYAPLEDHPLLANASPTAASPSYVAESDPNENPEEDPEDDHADYPADGGDGDDEPSDDDDDDDDTDDEDKEPFKDEEEEEEEHLAPADSSVVPIVDHVLPSGDTEALEANEPTPTPRSPHTIIPLSQTRLCRARKTVRLEPSMSASIEACIAKHDALLSPPLPVPSPPLPLTDIPEADVPPQKRACLTTPAPGFEVGKSFAGGAVRQPGPTESDLRRCKRTDEFEVRFEKEQDDRALLRARVNTLFRDRPDHRYTAMFFDREAMYAREAWAGSEDRSVAIASHVRKLEAQDASLIAQTSSLVIVYGYRCVAAALAERDANRSRNGDNSNDSRTDGRRKMTTPRECTYTNFLKYQPMSFQGTEGVIGLTRLLEKMESVFQISNCTIACQVKFRSCTLQGSALTWWNSHMRAVGQDVAYAMP
nr:reverse transcriptase domain-containing protein [Tanacetum cinerariifolium]